MPKGIPFMKAILEERKNTKQEVLIENEQKHQEAILQEAKLANTHAKAANETSNKAYNWARIAVAVSLIAIAVSLNNSSG